MLRTGLFTRTLAALALIAGTSTAQTSLSNIIYVDENATGGLIHDGTTWCRAFITLTEGLAASSSGRTIRVAGGLYTPDPTGLIDPRQASFHLVNGVRIEGGYAGCGAPDPNARDFANDISFIRGDPFRDDGMTGDLSNNSYHILVGDGLTKTTVLDGLYFDHGKADNPLAFEGTIGAGLLLKSSSGLVVNNCIFQGDEAVGQPTFDVGKGGAVYMRDSKATFTDTLFRESIGGEAAGGVYLEASSVSIEDSFFAACLTSIRGGGMFIDQQSSADVRGTTFLVCGANSYPVDGLGGGIYNESQKVLLVDCEFSGSNAGVDGAGIYNKGGGADLVNCDFFFGSAASNGGAIYNDGSGITLSNCLFRDNTAQNRGGAIYSNASKIRAGNCTFASNTANAGSGGVDLVGVGGGAAVNNCVLWGNDVGGVMNEAAQIRRDLTTGLFINYCDVQGLTGGLGGFGNIGADPLFLDPGNFDYHLTAGSPARNAGLNLLILPDLGDLDGDGNTGESTPFDLDGNPRISQLVVDMGAYELP